LIPIIFLDLFEYIYHFFNIFKILDIFYYFTKQYNSLFYISNSILTELLVTDTIPQKQACDKIKVLSVAELFAKAIGRIRDHESISSLFIKY